MTQYLMMSGVRYPMVGIEALSLTGIEEMEAQTGLTLDKYEELWTDIYAHGTDGAKFASFAGVLSSRDHRMALAAQIWICRRAAGDKDITVAEAADTPLSEWDFRDDADDEVIEGELVVDPPQASEVDGSGPVELLVDYAV